MISGTRARPGHAWVLAIGLAAAWPLTVFAQSPPPSGATTRPARPATSPAPGPAVPGRDPSATDGPLDLAVRPTESATAAEARAFEEAAEALRNKRLIEQYESVERTGSTHDPSMPRTFVAQLIQTVLMLVAVCALAYLLVGRLLPRMMGMTVAGRRAMVAAPPQGVLQVVDRLALDQRRSVLVVRVGAEHFLVGVSEQGMTMLSRLDDSSYAEVLASRQPPASMLGSFARLLERRMDQKEDA